MPKLEKIIEELQWLTDRISTQVRTMSLSLLAITWGLLIGKPEISQPLPLWLKKHLLAIGILVVVAMFSDFLQYLFGFLNTKRLLKSMEDNNQDEAEYDYSSITYRLRGISFGAKLISVLAACTWFLAAIIPFCITAFINSTS